MNEFDAIVAIGAGAVLMLGVTSGYIRNQMWEHNRSFTARQRWSMRP